MPFPLTDCIAFAFLAAALLLILLAPLAERQGPSNSAGAALVGAALLLVAATVAGWAGVGLAGRLTALTASALLVAALLAFMMFRARRSSALAAKAASRAVGPGANCRSRLTFGSAMVEGPDKDTWRTYLYTVYTTSPSDGELKESAKAWGGAYYGLYYTSGEAEAKPSVKIICEATKEGKCLADGSETGATAAPDPPVRVQVANVITASEDRVRVAVTMSAALNASGGPSITIAPGGVGPTISFPDASLDAPFAMGTYRWVCEKVEG